MVNAYFGFLVCNFCFYLRDVGVHRYLEDFLRCDAPVLYRRVLKGVDCRAVLEDQRLSAAELPRADRSLWWNELTHAVFPRRNGAIFLVCLGECIAGRNNATGLGNRSVC